MYDEIAAREIAQQISECWYQKVYKLQFVTINSQGALFLATNVFGNQVAFKFMNDQVEKLSLTEVLTFLDKAPSDDLLK